MIGERLGAYRIVGKLGEGGMGTVWTAEHALLGRRAAVKTLLPEYSRDPRVIARFFNEARAVTQIADAGIVQVFDFGHAPDGTAFIVMELLAGESLERRLARVGRLGVPDVLRLAQLAAGALGAAHAAGIVHRDLKPDNIYLVGDPAVTGGERPKILDFGIAKLARGGEDVARTAVGVVMGTPVYMSPEQCNGAADLDGRSDIYTLGCVMFTMLAGRPPYDYAGTGELLVAHLREPAPYVSGRVPGIPRELDAVLQRAMAKAPADRFQSMAELAAACRAIEVAYAATASGSHASPTSALATGEIAVPRQTGARTAIGPGRRRRGWWIGGAIAALGIAGAATLAVAREGGTTAAAIAPPVAMASAPRIGASSAVAPGAAVAPSVVPPSAVAPAVAITPSVVASSAVAPAVAIPPPPVEISPPAPPIHATAPAVRPKPAPTGAKRHVEVTIAPKSTASPAARSVDRGD